MPSRPITWPPPLERYRSTVRTTSVLAGAVLVTFHGWLFATQAAAGRLDDPWLVFRWLLAVGLVSALMAIRRGGASVWSRQGIAVWVLAALLHGPAVAADFSDSINSLALPETVAASVLQLVTTSALAITLWMLAGLLARRDRHARLYASFVTVSSRGGRFGDGYSPQYSSRPPPRA
ncbi:MAG: hypothetical protein WC815_19495 [Vicinamibacterales bacterium]